MTIQHKVARLALAAMASMMTMLSSAALAGGATLKEVFISPSPNAAVVAWSCRNREGGARSYVEYGPTAAYGQKTEETRDLRLNQIHWLRGLKPNTKYHLRLVTLSSLGKKARSPNIILKTPDPADMIPLKATGNDSLSLDQAGKTYFLTQDITLGGTGIVIKGENITLDLNGHTVTYGHSQAGRHHGILIAAAKATIRNGMVVQSPNATYDKADKNAGSYGIASFGRAAMAEISGVHVTVHQHAANPICFLNKCPDAKIHHNVCVSNVDTLKSRHYPGASLLRLDANGGAVKVHHNILLRGCHRGLALGGKGGTCDVYANDIDHTQGYTNGYAISLGRSNVKVHNNRITSTGRGMHVCSSNLEIYENFLDLRQHMVFDDRPQGSLNYRHYYTENHGIKLENCGTNVKVHHNKVISTQLKPDTAAPARFRDALKPIGRIKETTGQGLEQDKAHFAPATPLNFHVKPDSQAEIYNNEFVAITKYRKAGSERGYGRPGEWAAALRIVSAKGTTPQGDNKLDDNYTVYIHDNVFKSNDCFVNAGSPIEQTIRIEKNRFVLLPNATDNREPVRGSGKARVLELLKAGGNTFSGMEP